MWSREAIREQLQAERFDYQKVPLPHGLATEGHDRSGTAALVFSESLAGKSVLDVGCSLGFFCFEAEARGATDITGMDVHPDSIRKAKIIAAMKDSAVQFQLNNLETANFDRGFDVVLCLMSCIISTTRSECSIG
jgi:2-polyprenyl-3-methyl-5-hydroxy-6-metoxy-1,4-benzoquinol methylase